jgi:hypothetical protein
MSDLILKVKPTKQFVFTPDKLIVRTLSANIPAGTSVNYFELSDSTLDNSRYISREWVDKGNVEIPLNLLVSAVNPDGTINVEIANQFLAVFNLEIDTEEAL